MRLLPCDAVVMRLQCGYNAVNEQGERMNLSEEMKRQPPGRKKQRGSGRQAFLAHRNEIAQALADGYLAKEIWEFLHGKGSMPIQYRTFIDYVNRYIQQPGETKKSGQDETAVVQTTKPVKEERSVENITKAEGEPKRKTEDLTKRFEYSAKGKSKEDLI
jgi:hypothetical protein